MITEFINTSTYLCDGYLVLSNALNYHIVVSS